MTLRERLDIVQTVVHGDPAILLRAGFAAAVLLGVKFLVYRYDLEFISSLPLLTGLMGGVVFTLAILLSAVLADFKEAERLVGEVGSALRRVHADAALVARDPLLARMRRENLDLARIIHTSLRDGHALRMREIQPAIDRLDRSLAEAAAITGPTSPVRTMSVSLGTLQRTVDRLEVIVETTFVGAGYWFAGAVVVLAIAGLTLTRTTSMLQDFGLYFFAVFLLSGVYWLIAALDDPFTGAVRINIRQLEKVERWLGTEAAPAKTP